MKKNKTNCVVIQWTSAARIIGCELDRVNCDGGARAPSGGARILCGKSRILEGGARIFGGELEGVPGDGRTRVLSGGSATNHVFSKVPPVHWSANRTELQAATAEAMAEATVLEATLLPEAAEAAASSAATAAARPQTMSLAITKWSPKVLMPHSEPETTTKPEGRFSVAEHRPSVLEHCQ